LISWSENYLNKFVFRDEDDLFDYTEVAGEVIKEEEDLIAQVLKVG
jgi:hypothetical protein